AVLLGELDDLVLDARAVPRPYALDLPAIHRRLVKMLADQIVGGRRRPGLPAGQEVAAGERAVVKEAHRPGFGFAVQGRRLAEVDAALGDAGRGSGLESADAN